MNQSLHFPTLTNNAAAVAVLLPAPLDALGSAAAVDHARHHGQCCCCNLKGLIYNFAFSCFTEDFVERGSDDKIVFSYNCFSVFQLKLFLVTGIIQLLWRTEFHLKVSFQGEGRNKPQQILSWKIKCKLLPPLPIRAGLKISYFITLIHLI